MGVDGVNIHVGSSAPPITTVSGYGSSLTVPNVIWYNTTAE